MEWRVKENPPYAISIKRRDVSGHHAARFNQAPQSTARIPVAAVQPQRDGDYIPVFITGHEQPCDVTCTVSWPRWFSESFAQPTNPNTRHANPHNQTRRTHVGATEHTGAGEGIRTLDPNLGKVVLYP